MCLALLLFVLPGFSQPHTNVGTDFWVAFQPNFDNSATLKLLISSDVSTSGVISSAYPGVNQSFNVVPGIVTEVTLPSGVCQQPGTEDKGIRIQSNDPVTIYGLNSMVYSTDAFLALPVTALGIDYRVMSYTTHLGAKSAFAIVATEDNTNVTVFNHWSNTTINMSLNQGQSYLSYDPAADGQDVTGSRIQSDRPVAVFGTVDCVNIPVNTCPACDHIVEQLFPYNSWGRDFATVALAGRDNTGDQFRILSAEDGNMVSVNGIPVTTLNAGDYHEINLAGNNHISTTKPSSVAQFAKGKNCSGGIQGDPLMMLVPPMEQFLNNYTVINVSVYYISQWINVVAPDYAVGTIYLDGTLIPVSSFTPVPTTNFYGAQIAVATGSHNLNSVNPFGVFIYGWGDAISYGYPGGCSMSPVAMVDTVLIVPDTLYGQVNVSNLCYTATVLDNNQNVVPGILVNFYVNGMSSVTASAYTGPSGTAQYCVKEMGTNSGTDYIYAAVSSIHSDSSVAIWTYLPPCVNPNDGGAIIQDQAGCGPYTPLPLQNLVLPTGHTGNLEYKWQLSVTSPSSGFSDIAGSNSDSYTPGPVSQDTWFRRLSRVDCMPDWNGAAVSNVLVTTVIQPLSVSVSILASDNQVCEGSSVTFTATPTNPGTNPVFIWKVNDVVTGSNNPVFTYIPVDNDVVTCVLNSDVSCPVGNPALSNAIAITVNPYLPVSVSILPTVNPVCEGIPVTIEANPVNPGLSPVYQWKVNGSDVGTNTLSYSYVPLNGDVVSCVLTSSLTTCVTGNPATSNPVTMTVNPLLPVSVSISASASSVCSETPITLTAAPVNPGSSPVYSWKVNGVNAGTNSMVFTYVPVIGDVVACTLTSSLTTCVTNNPASSIPYPVTVNPLLPVSVTIAASANPVCSGSPVTFNATPLNQGTAPVYQWKVNTFNVGTNASIYSYTPVNGDIVQCTLTSSEPCAINNPAPSNPVTQTVKPLPQVTYSSCYDTITTITAQPFKLKGGVPVGGTFSGPGVNSATGYFNPSAAGVGVKTISYSYQNIYSCSDSKTRTITVQPSPSFTCGGLLSDIRDGKTYPTVLLGTQCWMQKNLDYGSAISAVNHQKDNCIPEKYCYNDDAANCVSGGGLYQWDEVMQYQDTPGAQGGCPPGWHLPSQTDCLTLFNFYQGQGLAGKPLQDSIISGFRAMETGVNYSNASWNFKGFGTIFWSSTPSGTYKAVSHGMNLINFSVSDYYSNRSNAFGVRCLRD